MPQHHVEANRHSWVQASARHGGDGEASTGNARANGEATHLLHQIAFGRNAEEDEANNHGEEDLRHRNLDAKLRRWEAYVLRLDDADGDPDARPNGATEHLRDHVKGPRIHKGACHEQGERHCRVELGPRGVKHGVVHAHTGGGDGPVAQRLGADGAEGKGHGNIECAQELRYETRKSSLLPVVFLRIREVVHGDAEKDARELSHEEVAEGGGRVAEGRSPDPNRDRWVEDGLRDPAHGRGASHQHKGDGKAVILVRLALLRLGDTKEDEDKHTCVEGLCDCGIP
mmetsp:Transcript_37646/g.82647  ORF Transcript_37646/g.82647 Transcript_37646/m.82647 type:complete len:285 (+) Transcript_37646:257-1111(+)